MLSGFKATLLDIVTEIPNRSDVTNIMLASIKFGFLQIYIGNEITYYEYSFNN